MNFAAVYLVRRFFYRLLDFFHHWYIDGSRNFGHWFISSLESLDRTFAIRITLRYLFHPLYKDYTIIGRILGFIFRSARIFLGLAVYSLLTILFLVIYVGWLLVPLLIIIYAARNL